MFLSSRDSSRKSKNIYTIAQEVSQPKTQDPNVYLEVLKGLQESFCRKIYKLTSRFLTKTMLLYIMC